MNKETFFCLLENFDSQWISVVSLSNYAAPPSVDVKGVNDWDDGSKDSTEKIQQQQLVLVEPKLWLFFAPVEGWVSVRQKKST